MNRIQQADYLVNHPSFKQAVKNATVGHIEDIRDILCILLQEVEEKTKVASGRCFGAHKTQNDSDIKYAICHQGKIETFDYKPPFIKAVEQVTLMTKIHKGARTVKNMIENQLSLFQQERSELTKVA